MLNSDADCECWDHCNFISQCKACSECGWADYWDYGEQGPSRCRIHSENRLDQRQKIIQKVVRVDSGQYAMNRAAMNVYQTKPPLPLIKGFGRLYNYPSTMSDRKVPHVIPQTQAVHRHSSSKHGSRTRGWPGMTSAAGVGVDVKHGSYDRYLARKKGAVLRAGRGAYQDRESRRPTYDEMLRNPALTKGGKNVKFSIISNKDCECWPDNLEK